MHFEAYIKKIGIQATASKRDTVLQLLTFRRNGQLLPPGEKNPAFGNLGKHRGPSEITTIQHQLNVDVDGNEDILLSVLIANIAHGTKSCMEEISAVIEDRVASHHIFTPGGPSIVSGLSLNQAAEVAPNTVAALDVVAANLVSIAGDEVARAMRHGLHHFHEQTTNHDCVVLYVTLRVRAPAHWPVGHEMERRTLSGCPEQTKKGNPNYTVDIVVKRQS